MLQEQCQTLFLGGAGDQLYHRAGKHQEGCYFRDAMRRVWNPVDRTQQQIRLEEAQL